MSFKAIKVETNLTRTLLVSQRSDIDNNCLPTNNTVGTNGLTSTDNKTLAIGSRAICEEDWSKWILSPENKWKQLPSSNSDSISSSDIITDDEIKDIINSLN